MSMNETNPDSYAKAVTQFSLCEIDKHFAIKTKLIRASKLNKPWINDRLKKEIKLKHLLIKQHKRGLVSREALNSSLQTPIKRI